MGNVTRLLACTHCEETTLFGEWDIHHQRDPDQAQTDYELWGCLACMQPQLWKGSDDQRLWPQVATLAPGIPASIAREMVEARACFDANLYTAAAVMVRRTLEGLCIEQGTQKKALFQALQELRDNGKIEGRLFDWAQALRVLGNQGAHFSEEAVSREDAADALSLAEALLNYIYVFTAKYEEFQNRRQASAN